MKKALIGFWVILQICGIGFGAHAQSTNDWQNNDLRGKVKLIHQKVYKSYKKAGKVKLIRMKMEQKTLFNELGHIQEAKHRYLGYGGNGKWKTTKYLYNKRKQCIGFKKYNGEKITQSCMYTLKRGNIVAKKYFDEKEQLLGTTSYKHNKKGLVLEEKAVKADGTVLQKTAYKYDRQKRVVNIKFWQKGEFKYETKKSYPSKSQSISKKFDKEGKLVNVYQEEEKTTSEGRVVVEKKLDADQKLARKSVYKYNSKGEKELTRMYNADGSEQKYNYMRYAYKYDKQDNWVRQIEFLANGNSLDVSFREITYFE